MRRGARIAGIVTAATAFIPLGTAALLASIAVLPHGDGTGTPVLMWPLKLIAFAAAIGIAVTLGALVAGAVVLAARLLGR